MSSAASYFEAGRPIEGEFVESWDRIERFYNEVGQQWVNAAAVLRFLRDMRRAGFDRMLRAGQSMTILVLSRSRRHGLRDDQPRVAFAFRDNGMTFHVHGQRTMHVEQIGVTPDIEKVLRELAEHPVD